jgi:transposase
MTRRKYTAEFKKEAARMILIDGISVQEVADQLGACSQVLYRWKHEHLDELEDQTTAGAPSTKAMAEELTTLRKELAKSRRMNEILKKNGGLLQQGRLMQYTFIKNNLSIFSVEEMCECFGLSRSGYYNWSNRAASRRSVRPIYIGNT